MRRSGVRPEDDEAGAGAQSGAISGSFIVWADPTVSTGVHDQPPRACILFGSSEAGVFAHTACVCVDLCDPAHIFVALVQGSARAMP